MSYNGQPMLMDANGKVIPQIYDPTLEAFVPITTGTLFKVEGLGGGGGSAMEFRFGNVAPANTLGNDGDVYLLTTGNNPLSKKVDGAWVAVGNLRGATGAQGTAGATGAQGIQGVAGTNGAKGDKGDKGDTGAQGVAGFPTQAQWEALVARVTALETP